MSRTQIPAICRSIAFMNKGNDPMIREIVKALNELDKAHNDLFNVANAKIIELEQRIKRLGG